MHSISIVYEYLVLGVGIPVVGLDSLEWGVGMQWKVQQP